MSRPLYAFVRALVAPFLRIWFRMHVSGAEHIPTRGAGDRRAQPQELLGLVLHRRLHAPARALHGEDRADRGALRPPAGAPRRLPGAPRQLRRGRARDRPGDPGAGRAAGAVPRGHAHPRPGGARPPQARRRPAGAGDRRAAGARRRSPAPSSSSSGPFPKPRRVQVAFAEPIPAAELAATPEAAGELVEEQLWPEVEGEYRRLRARPGVIAAGLAALGLGQRAAGAAPPRRARASARGCPGA